MSDGKDLGLPYRVGERVLDTVTGEEGVVVGGRVEHNPARKIILVRIGGGTRAFERSPEELHALPGTLAVPLDELER